MVDFADALAESPLESIARVVFRDCGLPVPSLQAWLGGTTEPVGRVDFYWKKYRTVAEVDGAIKYADPLRARPSSGGMRCCAPTDTKSCISTGRTSRRTLRT